MCKQPPTFYPKSKPPHQNFTTKKPFQWQFLLPKYWGIWLALAILLSMMLLPLYLQFKLGKWLGKLFFRLAKRRRQDTLINLKLVFPKYSEQQRHDMAEMVFINAGIGIFESLLAWFRPKVFQKQFTATGVQHLVQAQQQGKAILVLGAHYTILDLGGYFASRFVPVDVVYRPQNNPLLEWLIYNARCKIYHEQISAQDMLHLTKNLKNGHVVWYTPDQDFGLKQGVMAHFFGVPAATVTAQRRLLKIFKHNPPAVVMVHFYRQTTVHLQRNQKPHYHIAFSPVLENYPSHDEVFDANRINKLLENLINIEPTQYMWFHRRFKTQTDDTNYYV